MADAVGIATGVIALVQLTISVTKYVKDVKGGGVPQYLSEGKDWVLLSGDSLAYTTLTTVSPQTSGCSETRQLLENDLYRSSEFLLTHHQPAK